MPSPILRYFEYEHLPEHLQRVSAPICHMARNIDREYPDGPEKSAGLRKLLEAKDCFVRAALDQPKAATIPPGTYAPGDVVPTTPIPVRP